MTQNDYLHGFSAEEQNRLREQARFAESTIYRDINFPRGSEILEVGMGVGAQTEILLRRFPELKITGVERNPKQIETAKSFLQQIPWAKGRYEIHDMDANSLELENNSLDGAFCCWVLEHVKEPSKVLSEIRRVLRPGSTVYLTEVMNHSFFLDPYSQNIWKYWTAFNDFQWEKTGDPFVGAKLGNLLLAQGFQNIDTEIKTWHFDNRHPSERKLHIDFWTNLLLSAAEQLIEAGSVDEECVELTQKELKAVARDPNAVFYYSFMQAKATV